MSEPLNEISTPGQLRTLLTAEGVDNEVINEFAKSVGVDAALARVFSLMPDRFLPHKAGNASGVVQWDIGTPEGLKSWHVVIGDGRARPEPGPATAATTWLRMSLPDFLRVVCGELNGVQGVMTGKIKIRGNLMFAASLQNWFDYKS